MMGDDPKKIAMLIMGKEKSGEGESEDGEQEETSAGADAFAEAVSLAKSGDKMGAYEALKVAVASCQGDDD